MKDTSQLSQKEKHRLWYRRWYAKNRKKVNAKQRVYRTLWQPFKDLEDS